MNLIYHCILRLIDSFDFIILYEHITSPELFGQIFCTSRLSFPCFCFGIPTW